MILISNDTYIAGCKETHGTKYDYSLTKYAGFDATKTAHQICLSEGLLRIYDCGSKKYHMTISD